MTRLVDRLGRTGFAALTSLLWALPMAAWAGSADLSPIDKAAYPWIALAVGLLMLAVWVVLLTRLGAIAVAPRQRRFDISQMSSSEKRWTLAVIVFGTALIAWLNAAATVDPTPLVAAAAAGKPGPALLAIGLVVFAVAMVAGILVSWTRETRAFHTRRDGV